MKPTSFIRMVDQLKKRGATEIELESGDMKLKVRLEPTQETYESAKIDERKQVDDDLYWSTR